MPTYDYECSKCGHTYEVFQSMTEEPKKRCPECKGKVQRLISGGAGILFKGTGFYQTDYRSDGYKQAAAADTSSSSSSTGSGSKPSESKGGKKDSKATST